MTPVYLVGYMGAGKSTVGRLLADKLGWYFVDLDEAFAHMHQLTPADYIRKYGIDAFRRKEKYVLEDIADMSPYDNVIYATGGGYPTYEDNMDCLRELGVSYYLRWSPRNIAKRLMLTDLSDRPVLQGRTEEELFAFIRPQLEAREPFYARANHVFDVEEVLGIEDISETDDERIAEVLYNLIAAK